MQCWLSVIVSAIFHFPLGWLMFGVTNIETGIPGVSGQRCVSENAPLATWLNNVYNVTLSVFFCITLTLLGTTYGLIYRQYRRVTGRTIGAKISPEMRHYLESMAKRKQCRPTTNRIGSFSTGSDRTSIYSSQGKLTPCETGTDLSSPQMQSAQLLDAEDEIYTQPQSMITNVGFLSNSAEKMTAERKAEEKPTGENGEKSDREQKLSMKAETMDEILPAKLFAAPQSPKPHGSTTTSKTAIGSGQNESHEPASGKPKFQTIISLEWTSDFSSSHKRKSTMQNVVAPSNGDAGQKAVTPSRGGSVFRNTSVFLTVSIMLFISYLFALFALMQQGNVDILLVRPLAQVLFKLQYFRQAMNPLTYWYFNKQFRKEMMRLFRLQRSRNTDTLAFPQPPKPTRKLSE